MKIKLIIPLLCISINLSAQFSAGLKLNLGYGGISSDNLVLNLDYQRNANPKITEWNVDNRWGFGFGFGGFVAYNFSDNLSCLAEPTINFLSCGIDFTRVENKLDANGNGDINKETTVSDIDVTYFSLPLLLRYSFQSRFFLQAGLGINFTGTPSIASTATSQKDSYKNGVLDKTTIDPQFTLETKLNVFDSPRYNFVIGVGKSFDADGHDLTVDIRYDLPLTKSEMFTTDGNYNDGRFHQNDLLGIDGKADAEKDAPYLLNDYKMSVITLSVSYSLVKK